MKLPVDQGGVAEARALAERIVAPVLGYIESHGTVAIERAVLRLLGADGVGRDEIPVPNLALGAFGPEALRRG
ncbi:MAG: lysine 5,6-aminomutase subunit alpha TIM-barrel domain-containing protein, partial [Vulcanimicrobiaceae bacterium]